MLFHKSNLSKRKKTIIKLIIVDIVQSKNNFFLSIITLIRIEQPIKLIDPLQLLHLFLVH